MSAWRDTELKSLLQHNTTQYASEVCFGLVFFLNKRSPEHLSYTPSAIRTLSLIQNACSCQESYLCAIDKKIICHSTKPSFRVEVKEHVVRINCTQSFVTLLEGFYFPGA